MKIIQITPYYPPHIGGMQNTVQEISEGLAKRGHLVEVYTSDIDNGNHRSALQDNLRVNYLRGFIIANTAIIPSLFFRLMKIPRDSIMHVHTPRPLIAEITFLISKILNIPYVVHVHGDVEASGKMGFLLPIYKKFFWGVVLRNSWKVICLSEDYSKFIYEKFRVDKNKIKIIPNGVNKRFFIKQKKKEHKDIELLFVGRIAKEKNLPRLIKAVSLMKESVILNIVGDGNRRKEIVNLVCTMKLKNILIHGAKNGEELINFYRNADIFVLSSDYEGLPLTALEAMAAGVPVIASDVKGLREFIKDTGVLINPPTPINFARKLDELVKDKALRNRLSKIGKEKAKNHNWDTTISKLEELYLEIIKEDR